MIESLHLGIAVRSERDFELLTKLLDALGLRRGEPEERQPYRVQTFLPPSAALGVLYRKGSPEHADLELTITDPDTAAEIVRKLELEIFDDQSGPEPSHTLRSFGVRLPGGTIVKVAGFRTSRSRGSRRAGLEGGLSAAGLNFAIVASRFNSFIVERLLAGALDGLNRCGIQGKEAVQLVRVPGSFEIPSAARTLAATGKYDAIICLGCLLRGDTAHYDVIVNEVTRGIGQSAQETGVPHAFGVLTCDTLEQAIDRAGLKMGNKGFDAALSAVEMANLGKNIAKRKNPSRSQPVRSRISRGRRKR